MMSVNSYIDPAKSDLAIDLLNLTTSQHVLVSMSRPAGEERHHQYLLLSRTSAYDVLARDFPIYAGPKELVFTPGAKVFLLMPDGKQTIEEYRSALGDSGLL